MTKKLGRTFALDISASWENQLPQYLELYSKLSDEGKKEMQNQVRVIGSLVDRIQKIRKEKNE